MKSRPQSWRHWRSILAALAGWSVVSAGSAAEDLSTYAMVWKSAVPAKVDLGDARPRPAGQDSLITIRGGHLVRPNGERFRIWGVNLTGGACFPKKTDAPFVARYLARLGVNAVRLHFLDSNWGQGRSVFDQTANSTQELFAPQLDKLDCLVAELIKAGIYLDFNLNVGRTHKESDGVLEYQALGFGKGATIFSDRLIARQKTYARQLLTHRNPYTGRACHEEPAVLAVEIVNENSLVESWFTGRLQGKGPAESRNATWRDIPPSYAAELDEKFNRWTTERLDPRERQALAKECGVSADAPLPRLSPAEFAQASEFRFRHEARFILETEQRFYQGMAAYLKQDLGVRALVIGGSDHNHFHNGYANLSNLARLDVVDGHVYWYINDRHFDPATGQLRPPFRRDTAMVSNPEHCTVVQLARSAVEGKPYTVSETNHLVAKFECEGIPIVTAYAMLQDWDGLFFYTFEHENPAVWDTAVPQTHMLNLAMDPVKIPQLAAWGMLFKRGALRPSASGVSRGYDEAQLHEGIRGGPKLGPLYTEGFSPFLPLMQRTRIQSFDRRIAEFPSVGATEEIKASTGEIVWHNRGRNYVEVAAPGVESLIGYMGDRTTLLQHCAIKIENEFAAITCATLDGKPLAHSEKMLLVAAGRSALTDAKWGADGRKVVSKGRKPTQIEVIKGEFTLKGLAQAKRVVVEPLDGAGNPQRANSVAVENGVARIRLGEDVTAWFLLTVVR